MSVDSSNCFVADVRNKLKYYGLLNKDNQVDKKQILEEFNRLDKLISAFGEKWNLNSGYIGIDNKEYMKDRELYQACLNEKKELLDIIYYQKSKGFSKPSFESDNVKTDDLELQLRRSKEELNDLNNKIFFGIDNSQTVKDRADSLKELIKKLECQQKDVSGSASNLSSNFNQSSHEKTDDNFGQTVSDVIFLVNQLKDLNPDVKFKISKPIKKDGFSTLLDNIYISIPINQLKLPNGYSIENDILSNKGSIKNRKSIECIIKVMTNDKLKPVEVPVNSVSKPSASNIKDGTQKIIGVHKYDCDIDKLPYTTTILTGCAIEGVSTVYNCLPLAIGTGYYLGFKGLLDKMGIAHSDGVSKKVVYDKMFKSISESLENEDSLFTPVVVENLNGRGR